MSLTAEDLQNIRQICREENEAVENDVKDIYRIILRMQKQMDTGFAKVRADIASIAQQTGVILP